MATTIEWQCAHTVYIHLQKPTHKHPHTHKRARPNSTERTHKGMCVNNISHSRVMEIRKYLRIMFVCS